ncbi:MAG: hypothetical protein PHW56_03065 [Methanosarcinaceae archaeon]|nr:hypothetical protein [Methanosarcinaceae archaeon]
MPGISEETGASDAGVAGETEISEGEKKAEISEGEKKAEIAIETAAETKGFNNSVNKGDVEEPKTSKKKLEIRGPDESEPGTCLVRLEKHLMRPSELEIKTGDTVVWGNYQEPRRLFTLVSEENLFENRTLEYGRPFTYVFNETGMHNFSIIGQPGMKMTITVK